MVAAWPLIEATPDTRASVVLGASRKRCIPAGTWRCAPLIRIAMSAGATATQRVVSALLREGCAPEQIVFDPHHRTVDDDARGFDGDAAAVLRFENVLFGPQKPCGKTRIPRDVYELPRRAVGIAVVARAKGLGRGRQDVGLFAAGKDVDSIGARRCAGHLGFRRRRVGEAGHMICAHHARHRGIGNVRRDVVSPAPVEPPQDQREADRLERRAGGAGGDRCRTACQHRDHDDGGGHVFRVVPSNERSAIAHAVLAPGDDDAPAVPADRAADVSMSSDPGRTGGSCRACRAS